MTRADIETLRRLAREAAADLTRGDNDPMRRAGDCGFTLGRLRALLESLEPAPKPPESRSLNGEQIDSLLAMVNSATRRITHSEFELVSRVALVANELGKMEAVLRSVGPGPHAAQPPGLGTGSDET